MTGKKTNFISIVIPVYNSERTIPKMVDQLVASLKQKYNFEIILVNDCSTDTSEEVCLSLFKKYRKQVRFFSLAENVGEHNAVMAGLNQTRGHYAVIMDDDFQNSVSDAVRLIQTATQNNFDVIYTFSEKSQRPLFRRLGSWFANKTADIVLKKPLGLYLSSFKIINRVTIDKITKYHLPFTYLDGLILEASDNIGKLKVQERRRSAGRSGYSLKKLFTLWLNMVFNFSTLPPNITSRLLVLRSKKQQFIIRKAYESAPDNKDGQKQNT
ncbi:MAG: glycosyltransferase [Deltaproteobacteria bacterium]|nr:glycosyltransferase [Deltaproteobacteria bacterium]NNK84575.1 glycosyltransferase [Desulfobacterales bacterium]